LVCNVFGSVGKFVDKIYEMPQVIFSTLAMSEAKIARFNLVLIPGC